MKRCLLLLLLLSCITVSCNRNQSNDKSYSCFSGYYTNSEGKIVQSPTRYDKVPKGATARCKDGSYSFSRNARGTCSGHGGVDKWY